jgi:transcriptional regulator with XRE-family HTH domain
VENMTGFKFIRNQHNSTLEEFALLIGVSKQAVYMWENGKKPIPTKRLKLLSEITGVPEKYFLLEEVSDRDKLEIRKYRLEKEFKETSFEYEDEIMDSDGNLVIIPSLHFDSGLMEHIDFNDMELRMNDLFEKEKSIINGYKPYFGDEEYMSANDDLVYRDRMISMFDRFADIMNENNQDVMLYQIMRSMELFFNVNVKKNQIWGEESPFPTDLVKDEAKLVQNLVGVLQEHYAEVENKRKELQEDARWLIENEDDLL